MTILFNTRRIRRSGARDYLRGAASVFNLSGDTSREYNFAHSEDEADSTAIGNDWREVGDDLRNALAAHNSER
jgi:hypothetical protein